MQKRNNYGASGYARIWEYDIKLDSIKRDNIPLYFPFLHLREKGTRDKRCIPRMSRERIVFLLHRFPPPPSLSLSLSLSLYM